VRSLQVIAVINCYSPNDDDQCATPTPSSILATGSTALPMTEAIPISSYSPSQTPMTPTMILFTCALVVTTPPTTPSGLFSPRARCNTHPYRPRRKRRSTRRRYSVDGHISWLAVSFSCSSLSACACGGAAAGEVPRRQREQELQKVSFLRKLLVQPISRYK